MKTMRPILTKAVFLMWALMTAAVCCPSARAAVAERITYQGNLRESGLLVTASRSMTFRLYDAPAAGTLLWASAPTAVSVSTGVFRAVLTPSGLNWESALWLEVEVAGTVLSPREELTAAPFAANALYHSGKKYTNGAAAPASPGVGDLWFDTVPSALELKFWNGSAWVSTAGSGAAHAATHAGAGGDPITSLGAYTLTGIITMSPGTSLAAGAGSLGVSVSTHLVVSGAINPASDLAVGGAGFSVAFASAVTAGWFYGNGAGLSNISAAPPANMATTDTGQTITGAKIFTAAQSLPTVSSSMTIQGNAFSVGGSTLVVTSGKVGVGTPSPATMLDVNGGTIFRGSSTWTGVAAPGVSAAGGGALYFDSAQNKFLVSENGGGYQPLGGAGSYVAKAGDTMTGPLTMLGSSSITVSGNEFSVGGSTFVVVGGRVGIGTPSPSGKVSSLAAAPVSNFLSMTPGSSQGEKSTSTWYSTFQGTVDNGPRRTADISAGFNGGAWGNEYLSFGVGNGGAANDAGNATLEKMRIQSNGNVGISTANPVTTLDVNGNASFGLGATKSTFTTTGALVLAADPTAALQAATKQYVDSWTRSCVNPGDAADIMVPVGPWCVDKYEASVWSTPTGGTQYGAAAADYPCTANGQNCGPGGFPIYARSAAGVTPARFITWFQAQEACFNAGKELLPNAVWQAAASGTADPGPTGTAPNCNVSGAGPTTTGAGTSCLSSRGAENMIGSVWEWAADWGQYGSDNSVSNGDLTNTAWSAGASYGNDGTWGVGGAAYTSEGARNTFITGLPVAVLRGGSWGDGAIAGVFAFYASLGPSHWSGNVGFRCGRRR